MTKRARALQHALGLHKFLREWKTQKNIMYVTLHTVNGIREFNDPRALKKVIKQIVRSVK